MVSSASEPEVSSSLLPIGAAAARTETSERTLRYYEEIGLLSPSSRRAGGRRLYSEFDLERISRIRELQSLMGFDLEEIRCVIEAEDRLQDMKTQYRRGVGGKDRQSRLIADAKVTLEDLRSKVDAKLAHLNQVRDQLDARLENLRGLERNSGGSA